MASGASNGFEQDRASGEVPGRNGHVAVLASSSTPDAEGEVLLGGANGSADLQARRAVVSVIVPTLNEAGNVGRLLDGLEKVLPHDAEIIFIDDSTDETPEVIEREQSRRSLPIRMIHRSADERGDGLAGAVVRGFDVASAPWVCVMDADLQHPPELVPRLLERAEAGDVDIVVASRYRDDGSSGTFGVGRSLLSHASSLVARLCFSDSLRGVTDPMSGFFLVRRSSVDVGRLRPRGFKILLEILVRSRGLRVAEVPFTFGVRYAGESKASLDQGLQYLWQLAVLRLDSDVMRFLLVGASGLLVNSAAFVFFLSVTSVNYLVAAVLSTQVSTTWNYVWVERWVFGDRESRVRSGPARFLSFLALNNLTLLLRGPMLWALVSGLGMSAVLANFLALVAIFVGRFALADRVIWGVSRRPETGRRGGPGLCWYRIHDEVTVESPVRLRELERFRVDEPIAEPTIRVQLGRLNRSQSDLVHALVPFARHIRYDEGLGRFGFAVDITSGRRVDIVASPLLRHSPHVLYTNVVEPTLRWCFVERGYALAHGACIAVDGRAILITAKTDTGKTTTILKTLDRYPAASFLSDDLTLVAADGRVLTYPKPLTISRHTVASVKTPLLSRRERITLVFQSRIHSRSGRQFAQLIARLRLPAATINAYVQRIVPPPKYDVERLVPGVDIVPEAHLAGFVVIERGGQGEERLELGEAVDTLLANSEDAYGFPPYPALEHFLHSGGDRDLRVAERQIVAGALARVDAYVLRSEALEWWQRVAVLAGFDTEYLDREPAQPLADPVAAAVPAAAE
jgi:dolichol-phosphate mannosyltransferase